MRVSVAIQHHPARAELLPELQDRLAGLDVEVVTDPEPDVGPPSPLRTYTLACKTTPADATHRLVIQDDALPCQQFAGKMLAAVAEHPDDLLALFVPGAAPHRARVMAALHRGQPFARLHGLWMPTVALVWPSELAREFAEFASLELGLNPNSGLPFRGDDGPAGAFCQKRRIEVWAPVPSLVEHPDVVVSLIGRPNRAGHNRARVAAAFLDGPAVDLRRYRQRV